VVGGRLPFVIECSVRGGWQKFIYDGSVSGLIDFLGAHVIE
jgi:hypothetical protein